MRKTLKISLIILILISLFRCTTQNETDVIDINIKDALVNKDALVDDYFGQLEIIPLETTKESLFSEFNRLISYKDKFYVFDRRSYSILIFDKHGKFTKKIRRVGNGPGEYIQLTDFTIDETSGQIILLCDIPNCLIYVDLEGEFIKQKMKGVYDKYISVNNSQSYYATMLINDDFHIRVENQNEINELIEVEAYTRDKEFYSIYPNLIKSKHLFYFKVYDNIIYSLAEGNVQQKYLIDFGDKMIRKDHIKKSDMNEIINICVKQDLISRIERFRETNKYMYFTTWPYSRIFLYNKISNICHSIEYFHEPETGLRLSDFIGFDGDEDGMIFQVSADYFKYVMLKNQDIVENSNESKHHEFLKIAEKLNENDNPILIQCKFK